MSQTDRNNAASYARAAHAELNRIPNGPVAPDAVTAFGTKAAAIALVSITHALLDVADAIRAAATTEGN